MTDQETQQLVGAVAEGAARGVCASIGPMQEHITVIRTRMDERCDRHLEFIQAMEKDFKDGLKALKAELDGRCNSLSNRMWWLGGSLALALVVVFLAHIFGGKP